MAAGPQDRGPTWSLLLSPRPAAGQFPRYGHPLRTKIALPGVLDVERLVRASLHAVDLSEGTGQSMRCSMKKITSRANGMWRTTVLSDDGEQIEVEYSWTHPNVLHAEVLDSKPGPPLARPTSGAHEAFTGSDAER